MEEEEEEEEGGKAERGGLPSTQTNLSF